MTELNVVAEFLELGRSASYHYADDSGRERSDARKDEAAALKLFDNNPDLQAEMRVAGKGFLWSLKRARPVTGER